MDEENQNNSFFNYSIKWSKNHFSMILSQILIMLKVFEFEQQKHLILKKSKFGNFNFYFFCTFRKGQRLREKNVCQFGHFISQTDELKVFHVLSNFIKFYLDEKVLIRIGSYILRKV